MTSQPRPRGRKTLVPVSEKKLRLEDGGSLRVKILGSKPDLSQTQCMLSAGAGNSGGRDGDKEGTQLRVNLGKVDDPRV